MYVNNQLSSVINGTIHGQKIKNWKGSSMNKNNCHLSSTALFRGLLLSMVLVGGEIFGADLSKLSQKLGSINPNDRVEASQELDKMIVQNQADTIKSNPNLLVNLVQAAQREKDP